MFANLWGNLWDAANISTRLDAQIPFIPGFVFIYLLIFPFLALPIFLVEKFDDFLLVAVFFAIMVLLSVTIFMSFPTTMRRPEITGGTISGGILLFLRAVDGPFNLLPSLHVSSVTYVALVNGHFCRRSRIPSWILAVLISASTLFVKQHVIWDVLGGTVVGAVFFAVLRILKRPSRMQA